MKDIAIVGNSYKLKNQNAGSRIDAHELVFRVHPLKFDKYITGIKTDVYCCTPTTYSRFKELNLNCRLWMMTPEEMTPNHLLVFQQKYGFNWEYMDFPFDFERKLRVFCKAHPTDNMAPTTGGKVLITILDKYPGSKVTIYGMDWYQDTPNNYWYEDSTTVKNERRFRVERQYVERVLAKEHDITFFNEVVEQPKEVLHAKNIPANERKHRGRSTRHELVNEDANRPVLKQTLL